MKKIIFAALLALFAVGAASAQEPGKWSIGPQLGVYTNTGADGAIFGVGAFARYNIGNHWRVQPAVTALFTIARRWDFLAGFKWLIQTHKDSKNPIIINAGFAYRF